MASSTAIATRRSVIVTVVILVVLTILLAVLGVLYWILQRPVVFASGGTQDRHYLFSIYGFQGDLLRRPTSVGIDSAGNIFVADTGKRRIVEFDGAGNFVTVFGTAGKSQYQLWEPIGVAVAPDGRAYVVDKDQKKLVIYDPTHTPIKEVRFQEEAPTSVRVHNGNLFVTTESGVIIGTLDGQFLTGYVKRGKAPGQFDRPSAVAVGKDGTLYVADSLNYRVQAIGTNGKVKWTYGDPIPASQAVQFNGPTRKFGLPSSIAVDDNGYLYVVDGLSSEIVVLDSTGALVEKMGDVGHADGTFYYPDGIDYAGGRLVVADKFNDRVEVFSDPTSMSLADQASNYAPWGLLLLALPLALIPFLRRGSRYVMSPSFAEKLLADEHAGEVAQALRRVVASPDLIERDAQAVEGLKWVKREAGEGVDGLIEKYGLTKAEAESLAIAMKTKGKSVLLSDGERLNEVAGELDVATLTYDEILDAIVSKPAAEPEGEAA